MEIPVDKQKARAKLEHWIAKYRRDVWIPQTQAGLAAGKNSWFGGSTKVSDSDDWPVCADCGEDMALMLQLDAADIPEECSHINKGELLQFFYCSQEDGCETWEPFSGCHEVRVVGEHRSSLTPSEDVVPFPVTAIHSWSKVEDFPNWEEMESLGLEITVSEENLTKTIVSQEFGVKISGLPTDWHLDDIVGRPYDRDKLGGWPSWIQGVEYPLCPSCHSTMEFIFQIDSDDNIPILFGDVGRGHITRCPKHPNVLTFGWACY